MVVIGRLAKVSIATHSHSGNARNWWKPDWPLSGSDRAKRPFVQVAGKGAISRLLLESDLAASKR